LPLAPQVFGMQVNPVTGGPGQGQVVVKRRFPDESFEIC
jgi:hypothetical protein